MIRLNSTAFLGAFCLAVAGVFVLPAAEVSEKELKEYAHSLAQRGEFKSATEEYLRVATYFPKYRSDPDHMRTLLQFSEKADDFAYSQNMIRYLLSAEKPGSMHCLLE